MYVIFKRVGEIAVSGRIGGEKLCRRGDGQDVRGDAVEHGRERVARESDTFFGVLGNEWVGCGRGCALTASVGRGLIRNGSWHGGLTGFGAAYRLAPFPLCTGGPTDD